MSTYQTGRGDYDSRERLVVKDMPGWVRWVLSGLGAVLFAIFADQASRLHAQVDRLEEKHEATTAATADIKERAMRTETKVDNIESTLRDSKEEQRTINTKLDRLLLDRGIAPGR